MEYRTFHTKQSPFHKERDLQGKTELVSFRLPKEAYQDLMTYFEDVYDDNAKTRGFKQISLDTLENICSERKTYTNLEVYMILPKSDSIDDLNFYSQIIGFINTDVDFHDKFNLVSTFEDDYKIVYDVRNFEEGEFPMGIISNTIEPCIYRTNSHTTHSFFLIKDRLSQLFDIDVENCSFVRFPLNNYLDVFRDGQYQDQSYNKEHRGVYVFNDMYTNKKYYCIVEWYYDNLAITFDFYFESVDDFSQDIYSRKDARLIDSFNEVLMDKNRKEKLLTIRNGLAEDLSYIEGLIKEEFPSEYEKLK